MKKLVTALFLIIALVSMVTLAFTYTQVKDEEVQLRSDLQYRSSLLAESLRVAIEPSIGDESPAAELKPVVDKFTSKERLAGLVITDNKGQNIVTSENLPKKISNSTKLESDVMDSDKPKGSFVNEKERMMYIYILPLHVQKNVVGSLMLVQNAEYIDSKINEIWKTNFIRLFTQLLILALAIYFVYRWVIYEPIKALGESIRQARLDKNNNGYMSKLPDLPFLRPLVREISGIRKSLIEARTSASEEARLRLEKIDSPWTEERLKEFVKDIVKGQTIIAVSNREPYIHEKKGDSINYFFPASGMATAIEAIMQATGGEWIAHGSGSADKQVVDAHDRIAVPPDDPKYTLRRVWLTKQEEKGYYYGFSNEGLWPLCHIVHNRPIFRKDDWVEYQKVNRKFADVVLEEIKDLTNPIIFVQDFHFALLPKMIKDKRPDAQIMIFWHIPWPNSESFSICPFRKELLEGMLGADLIAFHTQLHCNNFIDTVRRELEALVNLEKFAVTRNNHVSYVKPFPISIAFYKDKKLEAEDKVAHDKEAILKRLSIKAQFIGLGVDRLDYTKGITERLKAVEVFLEKYPEYKNNFVFIQIAAPSRSGIKRYDELDIEVTSEVERINNKFKKNGWRPIVYLKRYHTQQELTQFYQLANVFVVTALHDGMNLIAKEFIAARDDERGVLILSKFAGASSELSQAFIINPYNIEGVADAIKNGLDMKPAEQMMRMRKMRKIIKEHNVYRWSAELIRTIANLE